MAAAPSKCCTGRKPLSNVIVIYHNSNQTWETSLYVDERNAVDFDRLRSR